MSNNIALAGAIGTGVIATGTVVTTAVAVAKYKQESYDGARNNNSNSAQSLPTMNSMTSQQRVDFDRRRQALTQTEREADQQDVQARQNYEGTRANKLKSLRVKSRAPAASSSSPSPALPVMPPAAARPAGSSNKQPAPVFRVTASRKESVPSRPASSAGLSAAASGSDARDGADRRQKSGPTSASTNSKSTKRVAAEGKKSFLDMS
ncbi:hypothetical protein Daus18300_003396 [Diaporthe australafricana]|uniref:Uncharacterized protein n=1 Tax=Diaporthe australafricana TaxID=127596 RepID=A0ABR3XFX2_9PEZI